MDSLYNVVLSSALQAQGLRDDAPMPSPAVLKTPTREFSVAQIFLSIGEGLVDLARLISDLWNSLFTKPPIIQKTTEIIATPVIAKELSENQKAEERLFSSLLKIEAGVSESKISIDEDGNLIEISTEKMRSEKELNGAAARLEQLVLEKDDLLNNLSATALNEAKAHFEMIKLKMVIEASSEKIDSTKMLASIDGAIKALKVEKRPFQNYLRKVFAWAGATKVTFTEEGAELTFNHKGTGDFNIPLRGRPAFISFVAYLAFQVAKVLKVATQVKIDYKNYEVEWDIDGGGAGFYYSLRKVLFYSDGSFQITATKTEGEEQEPLVADVSQEHLKYILEHVNWAKKPVEIVSQPAPPQVNALEEPAVQASKAVEPVIKEETPSLQGRASFIEANHHLIIGTITAVGIAGAYYLGII